MTFWERIKEEFEEFTSDAPGKLMVAMVILGFVVAIPVLIAAFSY